MLEDLTMEKKPSNRSQGTQKPSTSDSKKSADVQSSKPFPRSNRKREPANGFPPKLEPRKPPSQKGKVWDKRPRPRGFYYGNKKENIQMNDEELEAEFGTLLFGGSKRQSLNHLLNFHNEPRGASAAVPRQTTYAQHNLSTRSLMSTQAHKYNKEQFLQANCQFVVRFDGDYGCYLGDPDLLVDWNLVELIRVESCEEINCPICLYPPVAGKITRCGHIFCWTCILHYLALSDKTWRKCPICYESIHRKDLKSVDTVDRAVFSIGQDITLQLMKREKGSLIAAPVHQFDARVSKSVLDFGEKEIDTVFSKLLLAQKKDIEKIVASEYDQLQTQVVEFAGCPEICFVDEAMQYLNQRKAILESGELPSNPGNASFCEPVQSDDPDAETSPAPLTEEPDTINNVEVEDLDIDSLSVSQPTKTFYFYQSKDGQHIYLHSINVKMLEMTYGSLENSPSTINGKIVEKESGSMTGELRKRLRYMMHIPITCQFEVVEIELLPPLISHDVVVAFRDQVEIRKKRRFKQARAEKRREKKIEEHERKQFGRAPEPNLHIESHYDFPEYGEFSQPKPPGHSELDKISETSSRSLSPTREESDGISHPDTSVAFSYENTQEDSGMSFAKMLREGKTLIAHSSAWPTVGETGSKEMACGGSGAWGQPRRQRQASVTVSGESDCENYAMSPPARSSFNIAEALEAASRLEKDKDSTPGRKKKKKQKVLFATGLQCPGN